MTTTSASGAVEVRGRTALNGNLDRCTERIGQVAINAGTE